jgi:N-acetylmuramidase/Putative peptidoglycan binding domain
MFNDQLIKALVGAAEGAGIVPAALLAIAEVETAGSTFEADGRTPQFLYERHIAWREAAKRSTRLQALFAKAGLAIPKWSRSTQYKDQGTSAKRLTLIGHARAIDAEVANRSASWGIGQTMGFLAEELGFANAVAMVDHMTGSIAGQIDCMIGEIRNKKLVEPLNALDWPHVARIYNGAGYAANHYDTRLADAHKRWVRRLATMAAGKYISQPDLGFEQTKTLQKQLKAAGFPSVGRPDGRMGRDTTGAIAAFQAHEGLPVTSIFDEETRAALAIAVPAEPSRERRDATAEDLKASGSKTIAAADAGGLIAKGKMLVGSILVGGGGAAHEGLLDQAQGGLDKVNQAKTLWSSFTDLAAPLFGSPAVMSAGVILIVAGAAVYFVMRAVKAHRLADHKSGVHRGTDEE